MAETASKQTAVKGKAAEAWMLSDLLLDTLQAMVDEVGEGCSTHEEAHDQLVAFLGEKQAEGLETSLKRLARVIT